MEKNGDISWQSLFDLIDWHIESGTAAIVSVGTTGESSTIDVSEHVQIIEQGVQHSKGRIPIIAGTGANSTKEAVYLTSAAKEAGASFEWDIVDKFKEIITTKKIFINLNTIFFHIPNYNKTN